MNRIVYKEGEIPLGKVKEQHEQGVIHICPVCNAELIVIFSEEEMIAEKRSKGIYCPNDLSHIHVKIMGKRRAPCF